MGATSEGIALLIRRNFLLVTAAVALTGWVLYLTVAHHHYSHYSSEAVASPDGAYVADVQYLTDQAGDNGPENQFEVTLTSTRSWGEPGAVVAVMPEGAAPCQGFAGMRWVGRRTLKVISSWGVRQGPTPWRDVRVVIGDDPCHLP